MSGFSSDPSDYDTFPYGTVDEGESFSPLPLADYVQTITFSPENTFEVVFCSGEDTEFVADSYSLEHRVGLTQEKDTAVFNFYAGHEIVATVLAAEVRYIRRLM